MSGFTRLFSFILFARLASPVFAMEVKPPTLDIVAAPGGLATSVFVLRNTEIVQETYTFTLQGFRANGEDGRQTFLPVTETAGLPNWLYLNRSTVTLKPGESAPIVFQLRPPKSAAPGAYQAVVFANHEDKHGDNGVALGSRVGVLVFATITGDIKHSLRITAFERLGARVVDRPDRG